MGVAGVENNHCELRARSEQRIAFCVSAHSPPTLFPLRLILFTAGSLGSTPVVSMSGNDSSAGNMSFAMGAALAGAGLLVGLAGPKLVAKIMTKLKPGGKFSKVPFFFLSYFCAVRFFGLPTGVCC